MLVVMLIRIRKAALISSLFKRSRKISELMKKQHISERVSNFIQILNAIAGKAFNWEDWMSNIIYQIVKYSKNTTKHLKNSCQQTQCLENYSWKNKLALLMIKVCRQSKDLISCAAAVATFLTMKNLNS